MRIYQHHIDFTGTQLDGISWCILEPYPGVIVRLPLDMCKESWIQWWSQLIDLGVTGERWREMPSPSPFRLYENRVCLCLTMHHRADTPQTYYKYDGQTGCYKGGQDEDYRIKIPISTEQMRVIHDGLVAWRSTSWGEAESDLSEEDLDVTQPTVQPSQSEESGGLGAILPAVADVTGSTCGTIQATDVISYVGTMNDTLEEPLILMAPLVMVTSPSKHISVRCQHLVILPMEDGTYVLPTILEENTLVTISLPDLPDSCEHRLWKDGQMVKIADEDLTLEAVCLFPHDRSTRELVEKGARVVVTREAGLVPAGYRETCQCIGEERYRIWCALPRPKSARSC